MALASHEANGMGVGGGSLSVNGMGCRTMDGGEEGGCKEIS